MTSSTPQTELERAYVLLVDFQKWTYDTYQRDARLFLTIELLSLGVVLTSLTETGPLGALSRTAMVLAALLGILLTWLWASRQRREFYMSKGRLEELRRMEAELPPAFHYFSKTYPGSREVCERHRALPIVGEHLPLLPHLYRRRSFLRSLMVQQVFLGIWAVVLVLVAARWA